LLPVELAQALSFFLSQGRRRPVDQLRHFCLTPSMVCATRSTPQALNKFGLKERNIEYRGVVESQFQAFR
jgi:hypothetical protein